MLSSLKKIQSPDRILNQIQDAIAAALRPLLINPRNDGHLIEDVSLSTGVPTAIEHGLGRAIRGWSVEDIDAGASVWRSESPLPDKTLVLNSSADVVLKVWVY